MNQPYVQPVRKDRIDLFAACALILFSATLGFNQVVVKLVNEGMNPVFQAGLRSAAGAVVLFAWMLLRGRRIELRDGTMMIGAISAVVFALEFLLLFLALDFTTVARTSIFFYTMPVWVAVGAHFLIAEERMTPKRSAGLALAVAGVVVALSRNDSAAGQYALLGDLLALGGAMAWAAIALIARATRFSRASPEMQLLYQLAISGPLLMVVGPLFGEVLRGMTPLMWGGIAFQVLVVVTTLFLFWLWILKIYPASDMASFAFLAPVFGVSFGWLILGEELSATIFISLALVGLGIWLVNSRRTASPQTAIGSGVQPGS